MKSRIIVALFVVLTSSVLLAQEKPKPGTPMVATPTGTVEKQLPKAATVPELTKEQALTLDGLIKDITIAQQAIQIAVTQRDAATKAAGELIQALQVPGYTFDYQTKTYTKAVK